MFECRRDKPEAENRQMSFTSYTVQQVTVVDILPKQWNRHRDADDGGRAQDDRPVVGKHPLQADLTNPE